MKHLGFTGFLVLCLSVLATACGADVAPPASTLTPGHGTGGKAGRAGAKPGDDGGTDETGGSAGRSTGGVGGRSSGGSAGRSTGGTAGASGGDGADAGVNAPVVTITSPGALTDPGDGDVIANGIGEVTQNTVVVLCTAEPREDGGSLIDGSSVTLEMFDASGKPVGMPQKGAKSPKDPNEYSTKFIFTNVPNGKVSFRCTAKDLAGKSASNTVSTFLDQGPTITPAEPAPNSAHPLKDLRVEFTIEEAALLTSGDDGATVASVSLSINGVAIDELKSPEDPKAPYVVIINLADSRFPTKLNGKTSLSITAKNARGVTRTDTYFFIVDSVGPKISITKPDLGAIIGGIQLLEFTVKDDNGSGVRKDSVKVTVNSNETTFANDGLWSENMGTYTFPIDSRSITNATVQLIVNIRADDLAGNPSAPASIIYYLDTSKPIVDLDPDPLQERKKFNTSGTVCSRYFDPLGKVLSDWTTDPTPIVSFTTIRALVWDIANGEEDRDQPMAYFSGVNHESVTLYVQGDSGKVFLTDESRDGVCDEVDTTVPGLQLVALDPTGQANYNSGIANSAAKCAAGAEANEPPKICQGHSDLDRIIQHDQLPGPREDVVFAVPGAEGQCTNSQLQLSAVQGIKNGWLCLAVRAVDNVGNVGVSAPLRTCLNAPNNGGTPECAIMSVTLPPCTRGGCRPPPHFKNGIYHPDVVVLPE